VAIDDDANVPEQDLVLRIWQAVTLLGAARELSDSTEWSELDETLDQAETVLSAIIADAARSPLQRRRRQRVVRAAHHKPCSLVSRRDACLIPTPAFTVAAGRPTPKLFRSRSSECVSAAASVVAARVSSPIRFPETPVSVTGEAPVESALDDLPYLHANQSTRSAITANSDTRGVPHEIEKEKKHRSFIRYGARIGLTGRLFLLVTAAISPALMIQAWNEYDLRLAHEADVRQQVVQTTKQLGEEIGEIRAGADQLLLALTQLEIVKFRRSEDCRALLTKLRFQYPSYSVLGAADSDGRVFCANVPTSYSSVANLPFFTRAMAQYGLAVGNYWVDQASGQKMIHFAERFDDSDGQIAGVVFAGLDLGWLCDHLKGLGLSPSASVMIADREGNIIARLPNPERLVGKNMRKSHERIMDGEEAGWEEATGADGVTRIFGYVPAALPPKDFFLSTGQSKAQVFAAIDNATWRGVGLILASLFAAVYIAWAGARKFIQGSAPGTEGWRYGKHNGRVLKACALGIGRFGSRTNAYRRGVYRPARPSTRVGCVDRHQDRARPDFLPG
jgi:Cache domain